MHCGNRLAVARVRFAGVREVVEKVHGQLRLRKPWGIANNRLPVVHLQQGPRVVGIGFQVNHARGADECGFVRRDFLVRWKCQNIVTLRGGLSGTEGIGHPAHVAQIADCRAAFQSPCDFDDYRLAHAVGHQIGFRIEQDRAANRVAPIVVMRQAAQARLHTARDDRHALVCFAGTLTVRQCSAVRSQADASAGRIGIIVPHFFVCGVVVDHRVHVAGGNGKEEARAAELFPCVAASPIGLGNDADTKALGL